MHKRYISTLCVFFLAFSMVKGNYDSLLTVLDRTVDDFELYMQQKEARIDDLKGLMRLSSNIEQKYEVCNELYNEYKSYKSDSTLKYALEKLSLAKQIENKRAVFSSRLDLALIWAVSGMYAQALEELEHLNKDDFPELKTRYFDVYKTVLNYLADYSVDQQKKKFEIRAEAFRDSLLLISEPNSILFILNKSYDLFYDHKEKMAFDLLYKSFYSVDNQRYKAYIAYTISFLYQEQGNTKQRKYWLALSAINDLQSVNKEYISLGELAHLIYQDGDIDRSYKYIKRSLEDALFCNSRIRTYSISKMMPIIDKAYREKEKSRKKLLIQLLVSVSLLVLVLLIAVVIVYLQMKKLSGGRKELSVVNENLSLVNQQLTSTNEKLLESNLIKEEYIGRFVDQCSIYIDKLVDYRKLLNKTAMAGKIEDLIRTIKSKQFIEDELAAFYDNFDKAFLQLFPSFVTDFNSLLLDEEYLQLKSGQRLNTELRVYALMRLGFTDVAKISAFLRCTPSTIYNYRHKIKGVTKFSREEFEEKIMQIGLYPS
ncbi:MAG: DUF6377 domain-containing protein [Salinivirgaceae bacterium]|jgi:hypothetical protein|nr:DUF6377 domain-containing protein [Salinivirgaceae bacterium]